VDPVENRRGDRARAAWTRHLTRESAPADGCGNPVDGRRSQILELAGGGWWLLLARNLSSPNRWLWQSWPAKRRERRAWSNLIVATLLDDLGSRHALEVLPAWSGVPGAHGAGCRQRMRVYVTRLAPRRQWIRDRDNLIFSTKFLIDALVELGLLVDDSPRWADRPWPEQWPAQQLWTVVSLEPVLDTARQPEYPVIHADTDCSFPNQRPPVRTGARGAAVPARARRDADQRNDPARRPAVGQTQGRANSGGRA